MHEYPGEKYMLMCASSVMYNAVCELRLGVQDVTKSFVENHLSKHLSFPFHVDLFSFPYHSVIGFDYLSNKKIRFPFESTWIHPQLVGGVRVVRVYFSISGFVWVFLFFVCFCLFVCFFFIFVLLLVCPMLPVALDWPFLIASSVFSILYLYQITIQWYK